MTPRCVTPCLTSVPFVCTQVVPSVIFFNATLSVLYYYGIVQMAVGVVAGFVTFILGTGPWESTHAAVSVFMGWVCTHCSLLASSLRLHDYPSTPTTSAS